MENRGHSPQPSRKSDDDSGGNSVENPWKRCPIEVIQMISAATDSLYDIKSLSQADRHLYGVLDCFLYQFDSRHKHSPALTFRQACQNSGYSKAQKDIGYSIVKKAIGYGTDVNMVWDDDSDWDLSDREEGQQGSKPMDWRLSPRLTPLGLAARSGDVDMVSLLLQYGADVNREPSPGKSPIMIAVKRQKTAVVEYLLGYTAADVNVRSKRGRGILNTSIRYAERGSESTTFMKLLPRIKDPDENNFRGTTALFVAACRKNTDAVSALLQHPAVDPNLIKGSAIVAMFISDSPATPLMAACFNFNKGGQLLPFFQNPRVNFHLLSRDETLALQYAVQGDRWDVVLFLLEFSSIPFSSADVDQLFEATFLGHYFGAKSLCSQLILRFDMDTNRARKWGKHIRGCEEYGLLHGLAPLPENQWDDLVWTVSDILQVRNLMSKRFKEYHSQNPWQL